MNTDPSYESFIVKGGFVCVTFHTYPPPTTPRRYPSKRRRGDKVDSGPRGVGSANFPRRRGDDQFETSL